MGNIKVLDDTVSVGGYSQSHFLEEKTCEITSRGFPTKNSGCPTKCIYILYQIYCSAEIFTMYERPLALSAMA